MDKKKSILIYSDFLHKISKLSDEQAGKLFKGLLNYSNGITPEFDDVLLDYAFEDIKTTIDRDTEKYSLKCLKNKEIALERERIKRERNSTNVNERTQVITNSTDKDKDIDIDKDIDSDILLEKETKEENLSKENKTEIFPQSESVEPGVEERKKVAPKKERFKPPTVQEVQEYCNELQNGIQAYTFVNFYQSKGWKVGNQPMKDWRAAVRTWEQKNKQNGITNTTNNGFSKNAAVSNGKVSGRSIVADRISQHLARNSESGNHTIDIEANIVR